MTALDVTLLGGLLLLAALVAGPVLTIPLRIPLNYNEGWNAGFDWRAVTPGSGPLYPGRNGFLFDNYPPLGFVLVGAIGRFGFDGRMIEVGRAVAMLGLLASGVLLGVLVRQLGGSWRASAASSLLVLLVAATFYRGYVAMDDPQWMAHAIMLAGTAVLLGRHGAGLGAQRGRIGWRRIATAAGIVVAGGFVKHNLVALPLALTVWLLWRDRRAGLAWIAAAAVWLGIGLALLGLVYGQAGFVGIFEHRRVMHLRGLAKVPERVVPLLPAFVVMAAFGRRRASGDGVVLVGLFALFALVTGSLQRMGQGVSYNAHFELLIAVSVGFGLVLDRVPRGRWHGPAVACLVAAAPVIGAAPWHLPIAWHEVVDRDAREAAFRPIIARLAAARGPIGCETMSLCFWAGRPSAVDLFNLTQSVLAGGPLAPFRSAVSHEAFALIQYWPGSYLHRDVIAEVGRDPIMASFAGAYRPVMEDPSGCVLLAPRGSR